MYENPPVVPAEEQVGAGRATYAARLLKAVYAAALLAEGFFRPRDSKGRREVRQSVTAAVVCPFPMYAS